jgi:hypothetical protein
MPSPSPVVGRNALDDTPGAVTGVSIGKVGNAVAPCRVLADIQGHRVGVRRRERPKRAESRMADHRLWSPVRREESVEGEEVCHMSKTSIVAGLDATPRRPPLVGSGAAAANLYLPSAGGKDSSRGLARAACIG